MAKSKLNCNSKQHELLSHRLKAMSKQCKQEKCSKPNLTEQNRNLKTFPTQVNSKFSPTTHLVSRMIQLRELGGFVGPRIYLGINPFPV